jgi:hypothetical protein
MADLVMVMLPSGSVCAQPELTVGQRSWVGRRSMRGFLGLIMGATVLDIGRAVA